MTELLKKILEQCYIVPAETSQDQKFYELHRQLTRSLTSEQGNTADEWMDVHLDLVGDAAEDGFLQGFFAGALLISELYLRGQVTVQEKKE